MCVSTAQPNWTQKIHDLQVAMEESVSWECRASGRPRPSYRWLKNGEPLLPRVSNAAGGGVVPIGIETRNGASVLNQMQPAATMSGKVGRYGSQPALHAQHLRFHIHLHSETILVQTWGVCMCVACLLVV